MGDGTEVFIVMVSCLLAAVVVQIGLISPPVGMNMFVVKSMLPRIATGTIFKGVTPFCIAEVVLPTALTATERNGVVQRFVAWHDNYKAGADMGHGYGNSTLRAPSGPPVVGRYAAHFTALDEAARAAGARVFALAPLAVRRPIVASALPPPPPVHRLPPRPTGSATRWW